MHFELPSDEYHSLDSLRKESNETGLKWEVNIQDLRDLVEGDQNLEELAEDLMEQCRNYTLDVLNERMEAKRIQTEEKGVVDEEYMVKDEVRTATHNATVATIQSFCRNVIKAGRDPERLQKLIKDPRNRAECGKFALLLTLSRIEEMAQ